MTHRDAAAAIGTAIVDAIALTVAGLPEEHRDASILIASLQVVFSNLVAVNLAKANSPLDVAQEICALFEKLTIQNFQNFTINGLPDNTFDPSVFSKELLKGENN
jgi:hypothetical protein